MLTKWPTQTTQHFSLGPHIYMNLDTTTQPYRELDAKSHER